MLRSVGTRETRRQRGRRKGEQIVRNLVSDLRTARESRGVSQRAIAAQLEWSQSEVNRLEQFGFAAVSIPRLSEMAAVLGLELSARVHPVGDPIRDKGHQALIGRLTGLIARPYLVSREVPLPLPGDTRSWDVLLRLDGLIVGVDAETRIRDVQDLVRRIRQRERDGGAGELLLVLSDTAHNRALGDQLRDALGQRFLTPPRVLLSALRAGRPIPGSGVILL